MRNIKGFNESNDLFFIRDTNIKKQLMEFISFFSEVNDENISKYLDQSRMDRTQARGYFETIKSSLSLKKDNEVYGYLIDEYISIIDEILTRL
jgi:hypothetical protein